VAGQGYQNMASLAKMSPVPVRVLIADDHALFRDGLRKLLEAEQGFEVVGEAPDGERLVELARQTNADVILLDLTMPRMDGMEVLRELSAAEIPVRTLLLTASIEKDQIVRALQLGAYGVILKESTSQRLFDGIRCVMAGQYWVGRESVSDLVRALRTVAPSEGVSRSRELFGLTPRELEIVTLVVAGYSNPDIAQRCSISEQTVKHHVSNIFDKLGVSNRLELALFAVNHRLIPGAS
jgi:two-component system nitrate/nitrite response regulator NarL